MLTFRLAEILQERSYWSKAFNGPKEDRGGYVLIDSIDLLYGVYYFKPNRAYEGRIIGNIGDGDGVDIVHSPVAAQLDYLVAARSPQYPLNRDRFLRNAPDVITNVYGYTFEKVHSYDPDWVLIWQRQSRRSQTPRQQRPACNRSGHTRCPETR